MIFVLELAILGGSSLIGEDEWSAPVAAITNQVEDGGGNLVGLEAVAVENVSQQVVVTGVAAKPMNKTECSLFRSFDLMESGNGT